ncbi:hypothetical protein GJ744_005712 [Endocarpon pusillum]|uniref:PhoD-like phosphatase domain-containing protein n=1 Tax=Endocarpon pusillum TaxID=364733 RepID=A0A8H7E691_9EURO|nr:hypothetical protein GJ744_005712 [Endocarpon pusillum]
MSTRTQDYMGPYHTSPTSPTSQRQKLSNGAIPTSSQSRRQDQADLFLQTDYEDHLSHPPAAPEVPRAPPISYKQPYEGETIDQQPTRSFSQRAKGQMLAQEGIGDDRGAQPLQLKIPEDPRKNTTRDDVPVAAQNGLNISNDGRKVRRGSSQRQPDTPLQDSSHSTSRELRDHPRPVRHEAGTAPLKLDLKFPTAKIGTMKGPKKLSESQQTEWAHDRSPLQTLEVKLNDISKEEKRARVEEAEMLLREAKAGRGGRRSSKEVPATAKRRVSTREPPLEPKSVQKASPDHHTQSTQRGTGQPRIRVEFQETTKGFPSSEDRQEPDIEKHLVARPAVGNEVTPLLDESRSWQQASQDEGRIHPAHTVYEATSLSKPRQDSLQQPIIVDQVHPAHDPRLIHATERNSNEPGLQHDPRSNQLQNNVRRAASTRQDPVAKSIPSNITRAISSQQHQPQPLFADDQDLSRPGPIRESNSSHKAALAEANAAVGATGPSAAASVTRDNSRKLQKAPPANLSRGSYPEDKRPDSLLSGLKQGSTSADAPRSSANTNVEDTKLEFYYKGMPKQVDVPRVNSQRAPESAMLGVKEPAFNEQNSTTSRPRRTSVSFNVPFDKARPVNEWKQADTARLTLADLALDVPSEEDQAWWEINGSSGRRRSKGASGNVQSSKVFSQQKQPRSVEFKPPLYLKCGPLLRYTGMRKEREEVQQSGQTNNPTGRETWRGSVMIVTNDSHSSYEEVPTLRIFSQPRDLLPPPPDQVQGDDLAPEYVDPIAGLTKVSRTGQTLYVKPVDYLVEGKDLSRVEDDDGLFETTPSPLDNGLQISATANKRTRGRDGEALGKFKEVKGCRLYADIERDVTFWRFNIEVELSDQQAHIAYRINHGPPVGFWVPAKGQTMNIMFHSCNGFSLTVDTDKFGGPDPLWRDVLNTHQTRPFHVMIGGGDQLYNDRIMVDTNLFAAWTQLRKPHEKHHAPFTDAMRRELESFYLNRYAMWFSQGLFGLANCQIPMVNIYDDHDIIDGFGSYPDDFQRAPVFMGVGNIAFKYYMLFQHQSVPEETQADEPSWLLGAKPGPYIQQLSRSVFLNMGKSIAFLGLDCRTERERYSVMTDDTYDLVLDRCRREIEEGETKHLLVLLAVPIAYPSLVWLENLLTSRALAPVKALGRARIFKGGLLNKFEGGVEVLDGLDDHWTASGHKEERFHLIRDLQELAAEKSIRITILGGNVHLGAVGQFYSNPKLKIPKDRDHRYIPNVISSAIVNTPRPEMVADTLNKRNRVHIFDPYTMEDMIPMFTHDVDGKKRNNKRLLPRRNWCSIREYHPGSTPPSTPPESPTPSEQMSESEDYQPQTRRRFSFSREDAKPRQLLRRLSQRAAPPSSYRDDMNISSPMAPRRASHDGYLSNPRQPQTAPPTRTSFSMNNNSPLSPKTAPPNQTSFNSTASYNHRASIDALPSAPQPRPGILRRPTNLSEKASKKGGPPPLVTDSQGNLIEDYNNHIDLEGGLDITLNCEVNQGDPAGITTPYRLLVPTLMYDGSSDRQKLDAPVGNGGKGAGVKRRPTLLNRLGFGRTGNRSVADRQGEGNWGQASFSETESESLDGDEKYSSGEEEDQYYEKERRSSGGGVLKRWFSGRRGRTSQPQDRYSPEYEEVPPPLRGGQLQTRDEFVGRELTSTTPQPQQQWAIHSPSKRDSCEIPPFEPFPSQARGKAARVMGVDQGPMPMPYSSAPPQYPSRRQEHLPPPAPPQEQQNRQAGVRTNSSANAGVGGGIPTSTSINQSQPLPPPTRTSTLPLSPQEAPRTRDSHSRFYANHDQEAAPVVRGYDGVEAYPGRKISKATKGGRLRKGKWY